MKLWWLSLTIHSRSWNMLTEFILKNDKSKSPTLKQCYVSLHVHNSQIWFCSGVTDTLKTHNYNKHHKNYMVSSLPPLSFTVWQSHLHKDWFYHIHLCIFQSRWEFGNILWHILFLFLKHKCNKNKFQIFKPNFLFFPKE